MAVHKKSAVVTKAAEKEKKVEDQKGIPEKESVIVSDVVTETIEIAEVPVSQTTTQQAPTEDPLSDFKEKLNKEEFSAFDNAPKKNYMWPILFIFIAAVALLTGVFAYKQGVFKTAKIAVPTATPTPVVTPEPTKAPDLTKFEIEILNGSGVDGEAGRQRLSLTTEGFTVSSVGNADSSDYTDTIIRATAAVDKDFIAKLKSTLESSFTAVKEEVLSDDSPVPVTIILGTKN